MPTITIRMKAYASYVAMFDGCEETEQWGKNPYEAVGQLVMANGQQSGVTINWDMADERTRTYFQGGRRKTNFNLACSTDKLPPVPRNARKIKLISLPISILEGRKRVVMAKHFGVEPDQLNLGHFLTLSDNRLLWRYISGKRFAFLEKVMKHYGLPAPTRDYPSIT